MVKVSVIMPVYNCEKYVSQAIESVLSQTFKDWELIVVDDCSTDGTWEILKKYEDKIRLLHNEKNQGVSRTRNFAIRESLGEYLAFLDADDYWAPEKLEQQVDVLDDRIADVVHTGAITVADSETIDWLREKCGVQNLDYWNNLWNRKVEDYFEMLACGDSMCTSSIMVRWCNAWMAGEFEEGTLNQIEDWVFLLKLSLFSKFFFIPEKLTYYRVHKNTYTAKAFIEGKTWNQDVAIGQAKDRCMTFAKKIGHKLSYRDFASHWTFKGKAKDYAVSSVKKSLVRGRAKLSDMYHLNRHRFPTVESKNRDLMILFVTSKCNLRCRSCFYKDKLNSEKEMSIHEIGAILETMGKVKNVSITGGEPFLRKDIGNIIFLSQEKANVWINTNGYMPYRISEVLDENLKMELNNYLMVSVSIDGFEEIHNDMRGNENSYRNALDTIRVLSSLRKKHKRLSVMINTLISQYNIDSIIKFANEISYGFDIDYHNFEIVRSVASSDEWMKSNKEKVLRTYELALDIINRKYPSYRLINKYKFKLQYDNIVNDRDWPFPCNAGDKVFVVYQSGKLAACELRSPVIDLNDFEYNVSNALSSNKVQVEIMNIKKYKCSCTHGCWLTSSMVSHFDTYGWKL